MTIGDFIKLYDSDNKIKESIVNCLSENITREFAIDLLAKDLQTRLYDFIKASEECNIDSGSSVYFAFLQEIKMTLNKYLSKNSGYTMTPTPFLKLCDGLSEDVIRGKTIRERALFDFKKFVVFTIENNTDALPREFWKLSACITDYWRYQFEEDTNWNKKYSYIRLHQMINTINTFYAEQNIKRTINKRIGEYGECIDMIRHIQQRPGITYKRLLSEVRITSEDLNFYIQRLEWEEYLDDQYYGNEKGYFLTKAGIVLCQLLTLPGNGIETNQQIKQPVNVYGLTTYYNTGRKFTKDGFGYRDRDDAITWYGDYEPPEDCKNHSTVIIPYSGGADLTDVLSGLW